MTTDRATFLTGVAGTAAVAAAAPAFAASPDDIARDTRGMTFTTLRDGNVDHIGIRTARGIVDVARAAAGMSITDAPQTIDDRAHIAETGEKTPPFPDLFNKYNTTLNRHGGTVAVSHLPAKNFDYESELTFVVGKHANNVSEADALKYVYGYTIVHDFTARDAQMRVSQWMTGKTPDQFAPIGPWLVTADQIPDPQTLQIQTFVNDEKTPRQDANTAQMIFNVAHILSYTSSFITLEPGDVVFTGTPQGVISGYPKEKQVWLKPGDRIRSVITKLGELHFSLV
ncbi:MAG: fumarylacetoacetate hydrolase family protein [Candidatus Velthaea sp.]